MNRKIILIFVLIYLLCKVLAEPAEQKKFRVAREDEDVVHSFIPTHEWKVVKKGQAIPKGLHIRINLQTGVKEAKFLNKRETTKNNALLNIKGTDVENKNDEHAKRNAKEKTSLPPEELKRRLKNIKSENIDESKAKKFQGNFRNYEKLKEELGDLNLYMKSDLEILRDLFSQLKELYSNKHLETNEKNTKILSILQDFEYLVHQIDNANEFIDMNGLSEVVYKSLNSTNVKVKCESLKILGSSVQNNAKAQIRAFESGAIDKLLKVLALDSDVKVKLRAIYALGNLLRRYPLAQKNFIKNGGLNVFTLSFLQSLDAKLHMKIITLIYDLLAEEKDAREDVDSHDYKEKLRQYEAVQLKVKLDELGWCKLISAYLVNNFAVHKNDHDFLERYLNVMLLLSDICRSKFKDESLKTVLRELRKNYELLASQEERENTSESNAADHSLYFQTLKALVSKLLDHYKQEKTEL